MAATLKASATHTYQDSHQVGVGAEARLKFFERFELNFKIKRDMMQGTNVELAAEVKVTLIEW